MNSKNQTEWRGYTLEEMRYQRAASLARCIIARQAINNQITNAVGKHSNSSIETRAFTIINALTGNFKVIEYIMIGYRLSRTVFNLWRKFKR